MREERKIEVLAKPSEVYEYLCNPKNYLGGFSEVTIGKDGKSATAEIPLIGKISGRIEKNASHDEIKFLLDRINTSLHVRIGQTESGNTDVVLMFTSNPGFPLSMFLPRYKDKVINGVIDHGLAGKWKIKRKA